PPLSGDTNLVTSVSCREKPSAFGPLAGNKGNANSTIIYILAIILIGISGTRRREKRDSVINTYLPPRHRFLHGFSDMLRGNSNLMRQNFVIGFLELTSLT
uniref:Uncharacterized protein LOC114339686 n=1 Tax=Diabrotica virgifera virgifera TaxID=50390 RepID=A0A6P7GJL8_DIAVI